MSLKLKILQYSRNFSVQTPQIGVLKVLSVFLTVRLDSFLHKNTGEIQDKVWIGKVF